MGNLRIRIPVAANTAFVIAGTIGGTGGSPMPKGKGASEPTMWTSIAGLSCIRATAKSANVPCCAVPPRKVISPFKADEIPQNNPTLHLLLDTDRINYAAAINRRDDAFNADVVVVIDHYLNHVGNVSATEVGVASHTASAVFRNGAIPGRFNPNRFQNASQAAAIDGCGTGFDNVGTFQQFKTKFERIGSSHFCHLVDKTFAREHARWREH